MDTEKAVIKVIGIGGCGCNVINYMIERGIEGVEFIAIDADANTLHRCRATTRLQIGAEITKGLGVGAKPAIGRAAAQEACEQIKELLLGSDMVFIAAGMGGGTGTGAAPVVVQIARMLNILSVAVVTYPFTYEGNRPRFADEGIKALQQYVDSILIVSNTTSFDSMKKTEAPVPEVFKITHQSIYQSVSDICGVINKPKWLYIEIDISDLRILISKGSRIMTGTGSATGSDRAKVAAEQAIANMPISGANELLVHITSTDSLKLGEFLVAMECIQPVQPHAKIIVGASSDNSMGEELRITVLATQLSMPQDCDNRDSK